jgi:hypothetical protein
LLALAANNVRVTSAEFDDWAAVRELLTPGGTLAPITTLRLCELAAETVADILEVGGPSSGWGRKSGHAAEWVGAAIGAGQALARFDTPEFLATVPGEILRSVAQAAGLKSTGAVAALRSSLAGKLPDWRPDAAAFGAPGPKASI